MTALNVDFGALPAAIAEVERLVVEVALDALHLVFAAKRRARRQGRRQSQARPCDCGDSACALGLREGGR